jgi:3D (Asp-Asp-Asp) domain-containing protein
MQIAMRMSAAALLFFVSGCVAATQSPPRVIEGAPVMVWATIYRLVEGRPSSNGVPIRSMGGREIGPAVARRDWCDGALAGSLRVSGQVYNFAGVTGSAQANCPHDPSERVRWQRSPYPYGTGSRSNPLRPFRTIACDLGWVNGSRPWIDGGYPEFGQQLYISAADGVALPDGTVHDGIFTCEDTGGAVTGNHIDVFLGPMAGRMTDVIEQNPFDFVSHGENIEVEAILLPISAAQPAQSAPSELTATADPRCGGPAFLCRLRGRFQQ